MDRKRVRVQVRTAAPDQNETMPYSYVVFTEDYIRIPYARDGVFPPLGSAQHYCSNGPDGRTNAAAALADADITQIST